MRTMTSLFGTEAAGLIHAIDGLELANANTHYSFVAENDFAQKRSGGKGLVNQSYWNEILARAHLASTVSILRNRHWISAIVAAVRNNNLLSFAAAFRGLIESAADTSSTLGGVPTALSGGYTQIAAALTGRLNKQIQSATEIEDELIHFSHARHLTKAERATAPRSHEAKKVRDYVEVLEKGQVHQVIACYQALCDLTHPGASSVWMWLTSENGTDIDLRTGQDESVISLHLAEYRETFLQLLMFAFNPALVTLSVLNYFPLRALHTPKLLSWDLSSISLWQKCKSELAGVSPSARVALRSVKPQHAK